MQKFASVACIMKHHFDGKLRRIYKSSEKFFIKSPYMRICQNEPTPLTKWGWKRVCSLFLKETRILEAKFQTISDHILNPEKGAFFSKSSQNFDLLGNSFDLSNLN